MKDNNILYEILEDIICGIINRALSEVSDQINEKEGFNLSAEDGKNIDSPVIKEKLRIRN